MTPGAAATPVEASRELPAAAAAAAERRRTAAERIRRNAIGEICVVVSPAAAGVEIWLY